MYAKPTFKPTAFDHLESREVLSAMTFAGAHPAIVRPALLGTAGNTMKNVSQDLNQLYNAFVSNGGNVSQLSSQFPMLRIQGNSVSVTVKGKGNFNTLLRDLQNAGMTVSTSSAFYNVVVGFLPIASLPTVSNLPETGNISPNYRIVLGRPLAGHLVSLPLVGPVTSVHLLGSFRLG
jgi:hypothetical protein